MKKWKLIFPKKILPTANCKCYSPLSSIHPARSQIGLSLRILCGFGIEEIANAFLTNKETSTNDFSGQKKIENRKSKIEFPSPEEINDRLETVLIHFVLTF
jgi:RNA polymerase sigma-70 factor (ECF subfamily)